MVVGRIVAASLLLCSAASCSASARPPTQPLNPTALQGVWEMDGYALIMDVGPKEVVYYDVTAISCIESDRKPLPQLAERFRGGIEQRSGSTAIIRDHVQPYSIRKLAGLPNRCRNGGTVGSDPALNFEVFWRYMKENYANSAIRGVDWDAVYAEFRPQIHAATSPEQLWKIYGQILPRLDDVHVFLTNGKQGEDARSINAGRPSGLREALLLQNPALTEDEGFDRNDQVAGTLNSLILYDVLKGRYSTALNGKFQWGWASSGIGYLNIKLMYQLFEKPVSDPDLVTKAVDETMEKVLADFADADAIIIDVRQNHGGADAVARGVAARFADRAVSRRSRAKTPRGYTHWFETAVEPKARRFEKPVYVLVSENTVSAAELFALYMKEFPNVTTIGENTRGTLSDILFKKLPDGSFLGIANMQVADAHGTNFEVGGIPPDIRLKIYDPDRLISGYRDAIDLALRLQAGAQAR